MTTQFESIKPLSGWTTGLIWMGMTLLALSHTRSCALRGLCVLLKSCDALAVPCGCVYLCGWWVHFVKIRTNNKRTTKPGNVFFIAKYGCSVVEGESPFQQILLWCVVKNGGCYSRAPQESHSTAVRHLWMRGFFDGAGGHGESRGGGESCGQQWDERIWSIWGMG